MPTGKCLNTLACRAMPRAIGFGDPTPRVPRTPSCVRSHSHRNRTMPSKPSSKRRSNTSPGRSTGVSTDSIASELAQAGDRASCTEQKDKKNYAERFSRALARRIAQELRANFSGIFPDEEGRGQESRARSSKGYKRLDVNYSTPELGLGLGISIKTINFRDPRTQRYTKNYTRVDAELRAEATDYHDRQPYATMVAIVFLPLDCCDDGSAKAPSSFGQAVQVFRFRSGRTHPSDPSMLFERVFIGLYGTDEKNLGKVGFFDVMTSPPKRGRVTVTVH